MIKENVQHVLINILFGMEIALNVSMIVEFVMEVKMDAMQILVMKVLFFHKIL
jgi:hypothetical protein